MTKRRRVAILILVMLSAAGCGASSTASPGPSTFISPTPSAAGAFDQASAERYCTEQDGVVVHRTAAWNTNADPSTWLPLAGAIDLCEFESGNGDATTRISVDLVTLSSEQPTLAAIAYLSKVPPTLPTNPGANPAGYDCSAGLGGTSAFGNTAAGGGWVDFDEPVFKVMNLCVFADMSAIDEFGILYYSQGTVRGADLATKMRYRPNGKLPAIFAPTR